MSVYALRIIGFLFLSVFMIVLVVGTKPAAAAEKKNAEVHVFKNRSLSITCTSDLKNACEELLYLLRQHDEYKQWLKQRQRELEEERNNPKTIEYNRI